MKPMKGTEKAVQLEIRFEVPAAEKNLSRLVWIPKSQIRNGKLTEWIFNQKLDEIQKDLRAEICEAAVFDAENTELEIEESAKNKKAREKFQSIIDKSFRKE